MLLSPTLIMFAAACAIALLILCVAAVVGDARRKVRAPDAVRVRAPLFWRVLAVPIAVAALTARPWLSAGARYSLQQRLRRADLESVITAELFVGARLVSAAIATGVSLLLWSPRGVAPFWLCAGAALLGYALPSAWLRDCIERRRRVVLRQLPFYLDIITLAVESGLNLTSAFAQAVDKGPRGPIREELARMMRELRTGRSREEALRGLSERLSMPAIASLVSALLVAERQGASIGPVLRAQAEQRRTERFVRAERLAMEAPVKMLPPLLVFIFPCTFVMLLFPVASRLIEEGWLR